MISVADELAYEALPDTIRRVVDARLEMERETIRDAAYEEGHDDGRAEGYEEGYEAGVIEGARRERAKLEKSA